MVELLGHLRASGFKTYIASAGGIEFMRVISERLYGIPPEQVIGSSIKLALDEAHQRGWTVVSMKNDWKRIFAFE